MWQPSGQNKLSVQLHVDDLILSRAGVDGGGVYDYV